MLQAFAWCSRRDLANTQATRARSQWGQRCKDVHIAPVLVPDTD